MKYDLLSVEQDAKTVKGTKYGYLTAVLYMAPGTEAGGPTMCPKASQECLQACLYGAGMAAVFPTIKAARIEKTRAFLADPRAFEDRLAADVERLIVDAESRGLIPAVRVNGTSDQPKLARNLARRFPQVQFYDYTKIPSPWRRTMANYHLTFSHSGTNLAECLKALKHGINVAVVFAGPMPAEWHGVPVIDGDQSDLRFADPIGVIVGLKTKGEARKMDTGGFVQIGKVA